MTEKEWKIIGEEFISYNGGCAILITDGNCQFHLWETRKDAQKVCNKLNEVAEENQLLKKEILWWKYRCGEDISGDDRNDRE